MSVSVFFITCRSCTCSVTICLRSVIFCSSLANSCEDSGWFSLSCSSSACSRPSWMSSMGFTFSRPGRSVGAGAGDTTGGAVRPCAGGEGPARPGRIGSGAQACPCAEAALPARSYSEIYTHFPATASNTLSKRKLCLLSAEYHMSHSQRDQSGRADLHVLTKGSPKGSFPSFFSHPRCELKLVSHLG